MNIVLLGAPGAGKGTQAKVLSKALGLPHVSTGDILRRNVSENTILGKQAHDFMNKGLLVPDGLIKEMLIERFSQPDVAKGFILDGYPRTLHQAKTLDAIMEQLAKRIDFVFDLQASEAVIIQRLSGRLVCASCGANFHTTNMPPKNSGLCDACGGKLYQRSDDKPETIRKRLQVYAEECAPVINYYSSAGKLQRVSADEDAQAVLEKIMKYVLNRNDSLKV
jgi:adenylate kinase